MAGAVAAVMQKILANPRAADAIPATMQQLAARRASRSAPDEAGPVEDGVLRRTSVVPQGHRVRRDVDLRLVLGRLDLAGAAGVAGAQPVMQSEHGP